MLHLRSTWWFEIVVVSLGLTLLVSTCNLKAQFEIYDNFIKSHQLFCIVLSQAPLEQQQPIETQLNDKNTGVEIRIGWIEFTSIKQKNMKDWNWWNIHFNQPQSGFNEEMQLFWKPIFPCFLYRCAVFFPSYFIQAGEQQQQQHRLEIKRSQSCST